MATNTSRIFLQHFLTSSFLRSNIFHSKIFSKTLGSAIILLCKERPDF